MIDPNRPILGFRFWQIVSKGALPPELNGGRDAEAVLLSARGTVWTASMDAACDGLQAAITHIGDDRNDDHCGLYARHRLRQFDIDSVNNFGPCLNDQAYVPPDMHPGQGKSCSISYLILGAVIGSGDILVHNDAWRSQQMRVVALAQWGPAFDERGENFLFNAAQNKWITAAEDFVHYPGLHIAERLGVPLVGLDQLENVGLEYGQYIPKDKLPDDLHLSRRGWHHSDREWLDSQNLNADSLDL